MNEGRLYDLRLLCRGSSTHRLASGAIGRLLPLSLRLLLMIMLLLMLLGTGMLLLLAIAVRGVYGRRAHRCWRSWLRLADVHCVA